jgi:hypothetical protein
VRYIKMLGLAAVAAAAVMAFVGAGTASATVICATGSPEATVCGAGAGKMEYSGPITGTSTNATLSTNLANVICAHSETTLTPSSSTGAPIVGTVSALTFTECETEVTHVACTVTVRNLPYNSSLEGTALTVTDSVGAGARVVCLGVIDCEFLTKEANLTVKNGSPTTATATNVGLTRTGVTCPETATWSATYNVTSPAGLTVL